MSFSPDLAEIRFGCGLSPVLPAPTAPETMLAGLALPDEMARRFPVTGFERMRGRLLQARKISRQRKKTGNAAEAGERLKALRGDSRRDGARDLAASMLRWSYTTTGLRERLVAFWTDHFTAYGKFPILRFATPAYAEDAIRPHVAGSFADMLVAVVTHPLMLHFLDQGGSVGPGSKAAAQARRPRGLNENLAREVLELHTLGVGGPYDQSDVRQLAELFTGLSNTPKDGFLFRPNFAEPGSETVLGRTYGGPAPDLEPVLQALRDLALHPATARHLAWKMAVHFVSDMPDPDLVQHMTGRYADTGGNLAAVCAAMLEHPSSWAPRLSNVKPPADFIASAGRALALGADRITAMKPQQIGRFYLRPLELMGQPWLRPPGPDGWAEEDIAWVTPQSVSARLRWALAVPRRLQPELPDPRQFVSGALGRYAGENVTFAATAAETRADAIGLVLASPEFQRR